MALADRVAAVDREREAVGIISSLITKQRHPPPRQPVPTVPDVLAQDAERSDQVSRELRTPPPVPAGRPVAGPTGRSYPGPQPPRPRSLPPIAAPPPTPASGLAKHLLNGNSIVTRPRAGQPLQAQRRPGRLDSLVPDHITRRRWQQHHPQRGGQVSIVSTNRTGLDVARASACCVAVQRVLRWRLSGAISESLRPCLRDMLQVQADRAAGAPSLSTTGVVSDAAIDCVDHEALRAYVCSMRAVESLGLRVFPALQILHAELRSRSAMRERNARAAERARFIARALAEI